MWPLKGLQAESAEVGVLIAPSIASEKNARIHAEENPASSILANGYLKSKLILNSKNFNFNFCYLGPTIWLIQPVQVIHVPVRTKSVIHLNDSIRPFVLKIAWPKRMFWWATDFIWKMKTMVWVSERSKGQIWFVPVKAKVAHVSIKSSRIPS